MSLVDYHFRHLIQRAAAQKSTNLVDAAFTVLEDNADKFGATLSPELLIAFAEVASDLHGREACVARALQLYDRLGCPDDQFKVRSLLVRCVYEARAGTETNHLKGQHLLQQLQYALKFLMEALSIAQKNDRYGYLVYNASLVFWDVVRPMCRRGWQRHILEETTTVLQALKTVAASGAAPAEAPKKGGGGAGGAQPAIPVSVETSWLIELSLNMAFGLEDAGKDAEAAKKVDEANVMLAEAQKQNPDIDPKLWTLVAGARAYFARKGAPAAQQAIRTDIEKVKGSQVLGIVALARCGGLTPEASEEELLKAWDAIDTGFSMKEAKEKWTTAPAELDFKKATGGLKPAKLLELASLLRAACVIGAWGSAQPMLTRIENFQTPAGRGRILVDLSRADIDVWRSCNVPMENETTRMLIGPEEQHNREVEARVRGVRLCEQCIMASKRVDELDLVEESAATMWNLGRELMCDQYRVKIHKSLLKASEILDEAQSIRLVQLRVQLHYEIALCEVAQDLLTKGSHELELAKSLDYTVADSDLPEAVVKQLATVNEAGVPCDPAPYIRRFDSAIDKDAHLLHWKLSLYEDPTDPLDQAMLLVDQALQTKGSKGKTELQFNLLTQGYAKVEATLDDLPIEKLQGMQDVFQRPPRVVASEDALKPLPHQAPVTALEGTTGAAEITIGGQAKAIQDQRPQSEREEAVSVVKRSVMLACRIAVAAHEMHKTDFAVKVCDKAISTAGHQLLQFGPPPIEVEGTLLLAEAAYAKAQCLSEDLEDMDVINGIDEEIEVETTEAEKEEDDDELGSDMGDKPEELTPEEKAQASAKKREVMSALLYGMKKCLEFKQWWMLANGIAHWWNLHLPLVELSHLDPDLLKRTLKEYREGLAVIQTYLYGPNALPAGDFDHKLAANVTLAHVNAGVAAGDLSVLETDNLKVVKRLGPHERKEVMARVSEILKAKEKPLPDLTKLIPERLEGAEAAAPKGGKDAKKAPAAPRKGSKGESQQAGEPPKADLQGKEADVMAAVASIPAAKTPDEAKKLVDEAVTKLAAWDPPQNDERLLTLWIDLWTRLGRRCLQGPMQTPVGPKYALMCCMRGLGQVDAPIPRFASEERLCWRGACHGLCGEVFMKLMDPQRQEKESLLKLRRQAVEQFERCCNYAIETKSRSLAIFGAKNLWNVALPLLHAVETRGMLLRPLQQAAEALAAVRFDEDPHFFVGLIAALFDCYSDLDQWDAVQTMLNKAFAAVPTSHHRRLWALRMLALSRQGKNVVVAMGKMKESQATAQAAIWVVLAHASSKRIDQLNAYNNAIDILQKSEQPEVVEVRMEFADWLLRNGFPHGDAQEQLAAAADMLLEIEDDLIEEEDEYLDNDEDLRGDTKSKASAASRQQSVGSRSARSATNRSKAGSRAGSRAGSKYSDKSGYQRSRKSTRSLGSKASKVSRYTKASGRSSTSSKRPREEADEEMSGRLYSHHYEALCRVYAFRARVGTGEVMHNALRNASHFAVRFFASSLELAHIGAQELSLLEETHPAAAGDAAPGKASLGDTGRGHSKTVLIANKPEPKDVLPPFSLPQTWSEWATEEKWPWTASRAYQDLLAKASRSGMLGGGSCTWAGNPEAFTRPGVSYHAVIRLETLLEEQGYHLLALPILALHMLLAEVFPSPLKEMVACLGRLRLGRVASQLSMVPQATAALSKGHEALKEIPAKFASFEEALEEVRSQRTERGRLMPMESEWQEVKGTDGKRVGTPWPKVEVHAYEVWAELAKECLLHGEVWMATTLADEAEKYARVYGDQRAMREVQLTKAQLALKEGQHTAVTTILQEIHGAELDQVSQMAVLAAQSYAASQQAPLALQVLDQALAAIGASPQAPKDGGRFTAGQLLAEAKVLSGKLMIEIADIPSSQDFVEALDNTHAIFDMVAEKLSTGRLLRQSLQSCLDFVAPVSKLLEGKMVELTRKTVSASLSGTILTWEALALAAQKLCTIVQEARVSQEGLRRLVVPVEGVEAGVALPAEVITAQLDVCDARCRALLRSVQSLQAVEKERSVLLARRKGQQALLDSKIDPLLRRTALLLQDDMEEKLFSYNYRDDTPDIERIHASWTKEVDEQLGKQNRERNSARVLEQVEESMLLASNALAVLQPLAETQPEAVTSDGTPGGVGSQAVPAQSRKAECMSELGRLQIEYGFQVGGVSAARKWEPVSEPSESSGMQLAERFSNVMQAKDPAVLYQATAVSDKAESANATDRIDELGKDILCEAVKVAVNARNFQAAHRALQVLATSAYGLECQEASFSYLVWLQSVGVTLRAEDIFKLMMPQDHPERVLMTLLEDLEQAWLSPQCLGAYCTSWKRLQKESPTFRCFELGSLPSVETILRSYLPPLTLVMTVQVCEHFLYVGAAMGLPDGNQGGNGEGARYMAQRLPVVESELAACVQKYRALQVQIEKDLVGSIEPKQALIDEAMRLMASLEATLWKPIAESLVRHFWPYGYSMAHPCNPKQIVFLPDDLMWSLPFERMECFMTLFNSDPAVISRDLSLHMMAQRVRSHVEGEDGKLKPVPAAMPAIKMDATFLLSDPFAEDALRSTEDAASETLCTLHNRLLQEKVIDTAEMSKHGQHFQVSSQDIKCMLVDASCFVSLGFGRFFATMPSQLFIATDLRKLALMADFGRAVNDRGFRRQAKLDSMQSAQRLQAESAYGYALIAAIRGVQCMLASVAPQPTAHNMKCMETFVKGIRAGNTIAKAFADMLSLKIDNPSARFARQVEGAKGLAPPAAAGARAGSKKDAKDAGQAAAPGGGAGEAMLTDFGAMGYRLVGNPWLAIDSAVGDAGGKKKR